MNGVKVNGKMVSFDTKLGNGDMVEIIRRDSARPTAKWLDFAMTSVARRHIRSALELSERGKPNAKEHVDTRVQRKKNPKGKKGKAKP